MISKELKTSAARAWLKKASPVIERGLKPRHKAKPIKKMQGAARATVGSPRIEKKAPSKRR